ncbi:MAG: outer membrane protein assembly factor BamA [Bacteroidetes bacterium]|nr:outer membrane protein assembly factor BamA [Bacteroidota bacterium]
MNSRYSLIILIFTAICCACSVTKHVPEDRYLLDDAVVKTEGKGISSSEMKEFLRQKPNSSWPLFGKVKLRLNNVAWFRKILPGLTEKPVIYSSRLTQVSADQIRLEASNNGFLRASVDTSVTLKGRKAKVAYTIHPGNPYKIRDYTNEITDSTIKRIAMRVGRNGTIKKGMLFDLEKLDEEKTRITQVLRNVGYYNFNKEWLYYKADTTLGYNLVDLSMALYPPPDSLSRKRYRIGSVTVYSEADALGQSDYKTDSLNVVGYKGIKIVYGKKHFLRPSTIYKNNFIRPGRWYAERNINSTISSYSGIEAIKQVGVNFSDTIINDSTCLNARIILSQGTVHSFQAGLEGTNTAGDLGVAGNLGYQYKNLFNGAEILDVKFHGAYEFVSGSKSYDLMSQNFYEYGVETSLLFPQIIFPWLSSQIKEQPNAGTEFNVSLTNQHRPEYTREFFNVSLKYKWSSYSNRFSHTVDLFDVNFVRMPWVSDEFEESYINNDKYPLLKYSYQNQLISRLAYSNVFTSARRRNTRDNFSIRSGIEFSGFLPRLAGLLGGTTTSSGGYKELLGIRYAEYAKLDLDFARTNKISELTTLAYHAAIGIAKPYGNSEILPFEKRYFSGGSNSVRGWSTRRLGPGFYHPQKDSVEFANQVGDIKLDLSIELRQKLSTYFQFALFADAGNNWVIDNNANTLAGGLFEFSEFYKQIALAYGMGLRLDLGFLLLRFDGGFKAFDPGQDAGKRWRFHGFNFGDDFAFHFAIGYPF